MTEQEKREKAIEEMASDVRVAMQVAICDSDGTIYGERITTSHTIISERLLNMGYRKEEEVRKETAKEIFQFLYELANADYIHGMLNNNKGRIKAEMIKDIAKEFGVEVEE